MLPTKSSAAQILRLLVRNQVRQNGFIRYYSTPSSVIHTTNLPAPHIGTIKILSLNRPQARNAISKQLLAELSQEINAIRDEPENGPTRALILASAVNESFCAGADLKERVTFTQDETKSFLSSLRSTLAAIQNLPVPTLSAVHAPAFGGGLELALTTTLRLFSSNVEVALPETRLAILPGAGGTYRLPSIIGLTRARDMILTGRRVKAAEAYFLGLCDRLVEVDEPVDPKDAKSLGIARERVLDESVELARQICDGGPIAINQALKAVNGWQLGEAAENSAYEGVVRTKDRDEALAAFREKRNPVFEGK